MDNKEILKAMHKRGEAGYGTAMELARQDEREKWRPHLLDSVLTDAEFKEYTGSEREKMQGVDCYVSWDDGKFESPAISIQKPTMGCKLGGKFYTGLGQNITIPKEDGVKLGVSPGQCKKLRIVEEL